MGQEGSIMMSLLRRELDKKPANDVEQLKNFANWEALFSVAKRHDLAHLVGDVLERNGFLPDETVVKKRFLQERNLAVYRYEQQQYEYEQICDALERAEIPFIPLKGAVLRQYYPEGWMRTSCDIDVLVKERDLTAAVDVLRAKLHYQGGNKKGHDVSLFSESGVHLELHYKLNADGRPWERVLKSVWDYASPKVGTRYALTNEMFYFYHVAHMAGHFKDGGCGVRSFLDLYILKKSVSFDQDALEKLLNKGGLTAFNEGVCALAERWFGDGEETPLTADLSDYILNAGMYGDVKNRVAIAKKEKGNRFKILCSRIFLPYRQLKFQYPILQKHKILFPFYQVKRWFNLLRKDRRKKSVAELKMTIGKDEKRGESVARLLSELEL